MKEWYVGRNSEILGPIADRKLKRHVAEARIDKETEVRLGTDGQWVKAGTVEGLFDVTYSPENPPHLRAGSTNFTANDARSTEGGGMNSGQADRSGDSVAPSSLMTDSLNSGAGDMASNPYRPSLLVGEEQLPLPHGGENGLRMTRAGLLTCYYGVCVVLLGVIGGTVIGFGVGLSMNNANSQYVSYTMLFAAVGVLVGICFVGGSIALVVGQVLCLAVPVGSGCRGPLKIVLSMHGVWFAFAIGVPVMAEVTGFSGGLNFLGGELLSSLRLLPEIVGLVCFVIFLKKLAFYLGEFDLVSAASSSVRWVIVSAVLALVFPPVLLGLAMSGIFSPWLSIAIVVITFLVMLITVIRCASLVIRIARAIPKHAV